MVYNRSQEEIALGYTASYKKVSRSIPYTYLPHLIYPTYPKRTDRAVVLDGVKVSISCSGVIVEISK